MNRTILATAAAAFVAASLSFSAPADAENTVDASSVHALVLGSIGFPAYAKYTARAKFSEILNGAAPVKQQVELCVFDVGPKEAPIYCNTGIKADPALGQRGWNLSASPDSYQDRYTASISVKAGVITVVAQNSHNLKGATLILNPNIDQMTDDSSPMNWSVDPASTCLKHDLC
ncbi:MAG: pilin [Succinivibrionaceae bacterium]|nr:pilin [Succinivibrionaceae bacterium]